MSAPHIELAWPEVKVATFVQYFPGRDVQTIAAGLDVHHMMVRSALEFLLEQNYVAIDSDGRYHPTEKWERSSAQGAGAEGEGDLYVVCAECGAEGIGSVLERGFCAEIEHIEAVLGRALAPLTVTVARELRSAS